MGLLANVKRFRAADIVGAASAPERPRCISFCVAVLPGTRTTSPTRHHGDCESARKNHAEFTAQVVAEYPSARDCLRANPAFRERHISRHLRDSRGWWQTIRHVQCIRDGVHPVNQAASDSWTTAPPKNIPGKRRDANNNVGACPPPAPCPV